jgi:hypothetical protein
MLIGWKGNFPTAAVTRVKLFKTIFRSEATADVVRVREQESDALIQSLRIKSMGGMRAGIAGTMNKVRLWLGTVTPKLPVLNGISDKRVMIF